jgi:hypothetical protein
MSTVLVASAIADTPYGFYGLLERAKSHIFLAAQNHYFFVETPDRWQMFSEALSTFLQRDTARKVEVMLCDDRVEYAVKTWQFVTAERFAQDLAKAVLCFRELVHRSNSDPKLAGRIVVKRVPFVPLSITFVDPETEDGLLVLTPNAYEPKNRVRPCFIMSKRKNEKVFQEYWSSYMHRFAGTQDSSI